MATWHTCQWQKKRRWNSPHFSSSAANLQLLLLCHYPGCGTGQVCLCSLMSVGEIQALLTSVEIDVKGARILFEETVHTRKNYWVSRVSALVCIFAFPHGTMERSQEGKWTPLMTSRLFWFDNLCNTKTIVFTRIVWFMFPERTTGALTCCRRESVGHGNSDRKMFSLFRCHDYFPFQVKILMSYTNVTFSPDYLVQS